MFSRASRQTRFYFIFLCLTLLGLTGCQSAPPAKGLTAAQIKVLQQQGFKPVDDGWTFDLSGKVLFGSDVDALNVQSQEIVARIGKALLGVGIDSVRVDGHTDASGKSAYNEQLSLRRAQSVQKTLVATGMREQNIQMRGLGSQAPVASNDTAQGRTENRRVAIVVVSQ